MDLFNIEPICGFTKVKIMRFTASDRINSVTRSFMKLNPFYTVLLFSLISPISNVNAAGGAVNEDLAPLKTLTQTMISLCKNNNSDGFMQAVNQGLIITAENKNNSKVLPRVSAKFRAAKSAVKKGQFDDAIDALQAAEAEIQKKRVLAWDGGAE